jgi:uncharacterized damage-inducible protein DinB
MMVPLEVATMSDELLTPASPKAIEGLIEAWSSFTPATRALEGLTPEQAVAKLDGWPHSIAEVVAHMLYWQRSDFETIETGAEPENPTPDEDFPTVAAEDWPLVKDAFLASLERSKAMARDAALLERPILDGGFTVGLRMVWFTGHNAYHLGQVVFMRRVLGAWPPPSGSGPA